MSLSTLGVFKQYQGNSVTTVFSFPYRFLENTNLKVTLNGVEQTLGNHYTVTGAGNDNGGSVVMNTAPASGQTLLIERIMPLTQELSYSTGDSFPAETHEQALDRLTMITQQLNDGVNRSFRFPVGESVSELPTAQDRATTVLAFDENGEPVVGPTIASVGTVSGNVENINIVADNITDVNTTADNISNVNAVGNSITNVNIVAGGLPFLNDNIDNIDTVVDNLGTITTVGNSIDDVNTVAGEISNVRIVGNDLSSDYVYIEDAGSITDPVESEGIGQSHIITVSDNMAYVVCVSDNIQDVRNAIVAAAQTQEDALATAEDRVQTGLDVQATAEDRVATGEDRVQTGLDVQATAEDRVQTGLDVQATAEDRVQTGLDRIQTTADASQTAEDRVQTGLDVQATNTALGDAEAARDKAEQWADNDEDVEVETGQYSAKHWAIKAYTVVDQGALISHLSEYDHDSYDNHLSNTSNPHEVTKTQIGLSNVTNDAQLKAVSNLSDIPDKTQAVTSLFSENFTIDLGVLTQGDN